MSGVAFSCSAEGVLSVLALIPAGSLAEPDPAVCEDEPVMVHVTCCKRHVGAVRHWVRELSPFPEDVDTWGTEMLLDRWGQVRERMEDTPVYRLTAAGL